MTGPTAAPLLAVMAGLVSLVAAALLVARAVWLLGAGTPAAIVAGAATCFNPLLKFLGHVAFINLPFATLIVAALVAEIETVPRRRLAWVALIAAGLMRPEGWLFAVAYAVWLGRRAGALKRLRLAATALLPACVWLGLEAAFFGNPFYSFLGTRAEAGGRDIVAGMTSLASGVGFAFPAFFAIVAVIGIVASAAGLFDRRRSRIVLGAFGVSAATVVLLAISGVNVPSRHLSALAVVGMIFVGAGVGLPARLVSDSRTRYASPDVNRRPAFCVSPTAAVLATVALVVPLAIVPFVETLRSGYSQSGAVRRNSDLIELGAGARFALPEAVRSGGCAAPAVDQVGTYHQPQAAWALGVSLECVVGLGRSASPTRSVAILPRTGEAGSSAGSAATVHSEPGLRSKYELVVENASWSLFRARRPAG